MSIRWALVPLLLTTLYDRYPEKHAFVISQVSDRHHYVPNTTTIAPSQSKIILKLTHLKHATHMQHHSTAQQPLSTAKMVFIRSKVISNRAQPA